MYQIRRDFRLLQTPSYVAHPTAGPFVGAGDVVSGAQAWWGLRSYTTAGVLSNIVRLRRDSDNTEQDFATLSNGNLDVASISTFKSAANLFVVTLYDQTGNGLA
jgi:hypothetical protein